MLTLNPGTKFGRLTIVREIEKQGDKRKFECQCLCGKNTSVTLSNLRTGHIVSCGCYSKEIKTKHGLRNHPLYIVWFCMIDRCYNKDHEQYKRWGGRGIKVCRAWRTKKTGIQNFIAWAKNQWEPRLELDRIDNDGNYCPENCRFTTKKKQARNRGNNVWVKYNGKKMLLIRVWEKYGNPNTKYSVVINRFRRGWSIIEAIS